MFTSGLEIDCIVFNTFKGSSVIYGILNVEYLDAS